MRVGIVRTDLPGAIYLQDVENTSQRNFSSQPRGQSRNFRYASDALLTGVLNTYAFLSLRGSNTGATADTDPNDTLRIRASATQPYSVITVTASDTAAKAAIANELNIAFQNAALPFVASVVGTNQIQIDTVAPNSGPGALLDIDTVANGSTLNTALGLTDGATLTGLTLTALRTAVYPTSVTINVATATITALSTFTNLTTAQQTALVDGIAEAVAPQLTETGPVLRSFAYGTISKLTDTSFQPGGARGGLVAGLAAAVVADDGSTPFTL